MNGGKNTVKIVPQPRVRNKDVVDEDLVGGGIYSVPNQDVEEIMISLKRLLDGNKTVRERVDAMDDQVRRTQMDLESLVSRSANNNKHLQSLLLSSKDIKELHELLDKLSVQQQEQMEKNYDMETVLTRLMEKQSLEFKSSLETEKIKALEQKISELELKSGKVESLDAQLIAKEKQLAEIETKLDERQARFEELRQNAREMQKSLQEDLAGRYKSVHDTMSISMANLANASPSTGNTSRVASLLRNKYMNDKINANRRVISLNETGPFASSAFDGIPQNNSDFEDSS
ncbi:unnamed protein product [Kluyveromyces dobzhanskii CBS 2104]|uniref:WGS project CCBQ000000000 data, contig 00106 n=1 Tax=Kluyveromyces dobzhanskii CBS 2104 TaxID=1427455 RepID=A0A0A8L7R5_9SACH|nr:unnamed protein product [Kluyveromyces dobzhanskii CBS 2104]